MRISQLTSSRITTGQCRRWMGFALSRLRRHLPEQAPRHGRRDEFHKVPGRRTSFALVAPVTSANAAPTMPPGPPCGPRITPLPRFPQVTAAPCLLGLCDVARPAGVRHRRRVIDRAPYEETTVTPALLRRSRRPVYQMEESRASLCRVVRVTCNSL